MADMQKSNCILYVDLVSWNSAIMTDQFQSGFVVFQIFYISNHIICEQTLFLPFQSFVYSFSWVTELGRSPSMMLTSSGDRACLCLVTGLSDKALCFSALCDIICSFLQIFFIKLRMFISVAFLLRVGSPFLIFLVTTKSLYSFSCYFFHVS